MSLAIVSTWVWWRICLLLYLQIVWKKILKSIPISPNSSLTFGVPPHEPITCCLLYVHWCNVEFFIFIINMLQLKITLNFINPSCAFLIICAIKFLVCLFLFCIYSSWMRLNFLMSGVATMIIWKHETKKDPKTFIKEAGQLSM